MSDVNEFNLETGEFTIRPFSAEELEQYDIDINNQSIPEKVDIQLDEKLVAAINKLKSLGLTEEEAKAIAGI